MEDAVLNVLFVTIDKCPNLDAGAVRTHAIASMFRDQGHTVTVISMGPYTNFKPIEVEDIQYISFRQRKDDFVNKALSHALFAHRLKRFLRNKQFDVCVHTQLSEDKLKVLQSYSRKNGANLVYDAVEWFSPEQFVDGEESKTYRLNNAYNTTLIKKPHKAISISSYLHNNYQKLGVDSLLMPVVLDVAGMPCRKSERSDQISIIYAGAPGKKDYLDVVMKAVLLLSEDERKHLQFHILGCNEAQFLASTEIEGNPAEKLRNTVHFVGRVPRENVIDEYAKADFSILMRPQGMRYAQAGFPTKLVESLSTATPIICHLTSDIGQYVAHMDNGVIIDGEDEMACAEALKTVLSLKSEQIMQMQKAARSSAERYFDYRYYAESVVCFAKGRII